MKKFYDQYNGLIFIQDIKWQIQNNFNFFCKKYIRILLAQFQKSIWNKNYQLLKFEI